MQVAIAAEDGRRSAPPPCRSTAQSDKANPQFTIHNTGTANGDRRRDAADGRVDRRRHDRPLDQEGRRQGRSRRAAVRDLHRQGRRRNSVARRRRGHRDPRQGRRDGAVNTVVAVIGEAGATVADTVEGLAASRWPSGAGRRAAAALSRPRRAGAPPRPVPSADPHVNTAVAGPKMRSAQRSSPLVRKIAKEHHVDIAQIHGTGIAGRVTKDDILAFHRQGQWRSSRAGRVGRPGIDRGGAGGRVDGFRRTGAGVRVVHARRRRSCREDVGDAQEDRRAHGGQPADVGARALGLRGELSAASPRSAMRRRPSTSAPAPS